MGGCSSPNTLLVAIRRAFTALGVLSLKMGSAVLGGGGWKEELEAGRWVRHCLGGVCGKFLLQDLCRPPPLPPPVSQGGPHTFQGVGRLGWPVHPQEPSPTLLASNPSPHPGTLSGVGLLTGGRARPDLWG